MALSSSFLKFMSMESPSHLGFFEEQTESENLASKCSLCQEVYTVFESLPCLHTFCQQCCEKIWRNRGKIQCPKCKQESTLPSEGVSGILSDYTSSSLVISEDFLPCVQCKKETPAVASCVDCVGYLCGDCVTAHQLMLCFEKHRIIDLKEKSKREDFKMDELLCCVKHENEILQFFCWTCNALICKVCSRVNHPKELHDYDHISVVGPQQCDILNERIEQSKVKLNDLQNASKSVKYFSSKLKAQYFKAQSEINNTMNFYSSIVEERKEELMKELAEIFHTEMGSLNLVHKNLREMLSNVQQESLFVDRIMKFSSYSEILMFKALLDKRLQTIISCDPDVNMHSKDLEFLSNSNAIQVAVRNTFGYIRHNPEGAPAIKPQPIARPNGGFNSDHTYENGHTFELNISKTFGSASSMGQSSSSLSDISSSEKWSSGLTVFQNGRADSFNRLGPELAIDFASNLSAVSMYPLKSEIRRQKMTYHSKFGEFGIMDGQFTEPSGIAVNAQNDIIVADTNNHRIQIFDKEGRYKFQFGECGKRDSQLLYPNRVAVVKTSGDIIVTERSPTHQIQIYNQYGQFVRKFGANVLQHPRGVTVDVKGRIIVVECKVMRVIIFDQLGNVLQKFGCSKHLEFPNGIVVNDKEEIFISDNRAHCVKVFNYDGIFLRQIGGERITNYPIGVCINQNGEILVSDNHNNFNITVFTQDGQLLSASESKVKHAHCFDVALMDDGSVALASKDYRVYLYRYIPIPGMGI